VVRSYTCTQTLQQTDTYPQGVIVGDSLLLIVCHCTCPMLSQMHRTDELITLQHLCIHMTPYIVKAVCLGITAPHLAGQARCRWHAHARLMHIQKIAMVKQLGNERNTHTSCLADWYASTGSHVSMPATCMQPSGNELGPMGPTTPEQLLHEERIEKVTSGEVELLAAHQRVPVLHHHRRHIAAEATKHISAAQCQLALVSTWGLLRTRQQRLTEANTGPAIVTQHDSIAWCFNKANMDSS